MKKEICIYSWVTYLCIHSFFLSIYHFIAFAANLCFSSSVCLCIYPNALPECKILLHKVTEWMNELIKVKQFCVCVHTSIRKFQKSHGTAMLQWSNDFFPPPLHSSFLNPTEINLLRWKFSILLRLQNGNSLTGLSAVVMENHFGLSKLLSLHLWGLEVTESHLSISYENTTEDF